MKWRVGISRIELESTAKRWHGEILTLLRTYGRISFVHGIAGQTGGFTCTSPQTSLSEMVLNASRSAGPTIGLGLNRTAYLSLCLHVHDLLLDLAAVLRIHCCG